MSIAHNSTNNDDEDSELPTPPDGGWGWAVVFASFMIHIVTDGVTYSFGVFYDEFLTYFDEGKGATAWILSILVGMTLCSGPLSSSFVNRWGCRAVTIAGAILASVCMILSCFAQNVVTLYFTVGIGAGTGFGLIYLPAIVCVTMYFEKKRSLATGIAVCGSGFGTFVFAPVINLLLIKYGWRGAMLIVAAIILECIIFGALFRPLKYQVTSPEKTAEPEELSYIALKASAAATDFGISTESVELTSDKEEQNQKRPRPRSMGHFSSTAKSARNLSLEKNGGLPNDSAKTHAVRLAASHPVLSFTQYETKKQPHHQSQHIKIVKPLSRPDIFYQGSLVNISPQQSHSCGSVKQNEDENLLRRRSSNLSKHSRHTAEPEKELTKVCGIIPCTEETAETLNKMLDLSLFRNPLFLIYVLSNFFTSIGFNVPYVYMVSKAKALGISAENASMLLSVIGIANTVGRIILGYISDNPKVNRLMIYIVCLTICGLATAFSAFCLDFYSLAIYSAVFGFTIGAYVGLTSVILVDLLGLEKLTNAFGLLLLFQGIASLIGPPIAGELYDKLNSYDPGFYLAGIMMAISGLMLFAIPPVQKWQQGKKSRTSATVTM